eukprot:CAMPEP_0201611494 /NCGR_PEP_ID=MMETSP0492-20130828/20263_1 /ASSEMBLY_ACC=CAM_ASM_000837 /TAXON_ID=420259 /ORGANISM="Thalassiosira gravida, Strain GMp14c1" /LENGTH=144 /DNA_ID=CAMNT_0048077691 /DNA_START=76 /DNA_END=510 /DNA_ORIENTATION=-
MIFSKAAFIVTAAFLPSASALGGDVVLKDDSTLSDQGAWASNDSTLSDPLSLRGASETSAQAGLICEVADCTTPTRFGCWKCTCIFSSNCPEGYHCDGIVGNRFCELSRESGELCDEDNDCISGECNYVNSWIPSCASGNCQCV